MFENKKILILGMARSGFEAARVLIKKNNKVILNERDATVDEDKKRELESLGVKLILGGHPENLLDDSFDFLIKNPGVPINHPYVLKARELNIEVINEVEMAYRLLEKPLNLIGITGTNGKTTTTTLIYEFIKEANRRVHLTGNIGYPLCSFLDKIKKDDLVIMETSCQQLENLSEFNPKVAIMTNLSEAHIDFFGDYESYKRVKLKIFQNHTKEDIAILNYEDKGVLELCKDIKSTIKYFSSKKKIKGAYIKDNSIYYLEDKIISLDEVKLIGVHNYENILAAIVAVKEFNIRDEDIIKVLREFGGVEHRNEFVREVNNIKFYNDSKATNIKATQIALGSFKSPVILLLGGMDRGQDFEELEPFMERVEYVIAYGEARERVKDFANKYKFKNEVFNTLEESVRRAFELAKEKDTILLSPASASWDQYKSFEERGEEFKKIVNGF